MLTAMEIFINAESIEAQTKRVEYSNRRTLDLYKPVKAPKINMLAML